MKIMLVEGKGDKQVKDGDIIDVGKVKIKTLIYTWSYKWKCFLFS